MHPLGMTFPLRLKMSLHMRLSMILPAVLILTGCAAHNRDKTWDRQFVNTSVKYAEDNMHTWRDAYYTAVAPGSTASEDEKVTDRNRIINAYLLIVDIAYGKFEGGYNSQIAYFETGSDLVNLGLTAASAVTAPAAELGAAATGGLGVKASVEKNALNSQTRFVILNRMAAIRDKDRAVILHRELLPVTCTGATPAPPTSTPSNSTTAVSDVCYSLEDAMRDVNDYFYTGTITRALSDIDSQSAQISQQSKGAQATSAQPAAPMFTPASLPASLNAGAMTSITIRASGVPTPGLILIGGSAGGPTLKDNGDGTATLSGTLLHGTYDMKITAHNASGQDATLPWTLTVN